MNYNIMYSNLSRLHDGNLYLKYLLEKKLNIATLRNIFFRSSPLNKINRKLKYYVLTSVIEKI